MFDKVVVNMFDIMLSDTFGAEGRISMASLSSYFAHGEVVCQELIPIPEERKIKGIALRYVSISLFSLNYT